MSYIEKKILWLKAFSQDKKAKPLLNHKYSQLNISDDMRPCGANFNLKKLQFLTHPRLQDNYTGHGKTHCWNIFFWSFLTKTKWTSLLPSHFQSKFLLGALRFALWNFDQKISHYFTLQPYSMLFQPDCTQLYINMFYKCPEGNFETVLKEKKLKKMFKKNWKKIWKKIWK